MNLTDGFVTYLMEKSDVPLSDNVLRQVEQCLVDYMGVTIAGHAAAAEKLRGYEENLCLGPVKVVGGQRETDGLSAAFLNGFSAHVLELDDGHRFGMIHLAAPILPAVLSAVQMAGLVEWRQMALGIVMGYEAAVRLARGMQPEHKKRGYHTAGTCGTVGAAVGAAFALGCDAQVLKRTLSAAGTSAAGLLEIQEGASELKPYNVAHAAMSGLNAALTGRQPFAFPEDILGGDRGIVRVMAGEPNRQGMLEKTSDYEIERIYRKPYAACRHCHSAVEAALTIRAREGVTSDQIQSIAVDTYHMAVRGHDHQEILGAASAKLSIPYSVAVAVVTGDCGLQAFSEEKVHNPEILALTRRVKVQERGAFTELSPGRRVAEVCIRCRDGQEYTQRVDYAKGDPENPMTAQEIQKKYLALMSWAGQQARAESLLQAISAADVRQMIQRM